MRKIGQVPPAEISVPSVIAKALGNDAILFKRAKMCVSQSFGLGACAYLRRILENNVDELLRMIRAARELEGATEPELRKIDDALNGKSFEDKTSVAYSAAPTSLTVDGVNPFKLIHDELSRNLHAMSEDECTLAAQRVASSIAFVVTELKRQHQMRDEFAEEMRALVALRSER